MPNCPLCQTALEDDFGLVDCPGCNAPLFVDFDGHVTASGGQSPHNSDGQPQNSELEPQQSTQSHQGDEQEVQSDFATLPHEPVFEEDHFSVADFSQEQEPQQEQEAEPELQSPPEPEWELSEQGPEPHQATSEDLSDLSDFANSPLSQGNDGLLRFKILIEGVDSMDLRRDLSEALDDKKFVWDKDEIMRSIEQGRLVLEDVSAVKAVLLIRRLRGLTLQISWEQYAIHQL